MPKQKKLNNFNSVLPNSAYFKDEYLKLELDTCFKNSPKYVGHELMVPDNGNFFSLPQENHKRILVRDQNEILLISNLCKHRQAIMLEGQGSIRNIVCPIHGWTYELSGKLKGAPYFAKTPCAALEKTEIYNWKGMLFEKNNYLKNFFEKIPFSKELSFDGYVLKDIKKHVCNYNWKTFIEVYLDDYHVNSYHPGLGNFVDCQNLTWRFDDQYSIQAVGISDLSNHSTPNYEKFSQLVKKIYDGKLPKFGAIWLLIYPNLMLEWYPKSLVVSSLYPLSPQKTINITEFYYPEEISFFDDEFIEAQQNAYNETVVEDDEIAIKLEKGKKSLLEDNLNNNGPYHTELEAGIPYFHEFMNRNCYSIEKI